MWGVRRGRRVDSSHDPVPCPEEQLLPVKDVKALFISEEGKKLIRNEVYIKNGEKVRRGV